jgi:PAS domain S-box-containing protein
MPSSMKENTTPQRILSYLKECPEGANIIEISKRIGIGRNQVARYLTNLSQVGRLDLITDGNNKIYRLAHRIPFHLFSIYPKGGAIGFNRSLLVQEVSERALNILGCFESDLIDKWIEDLPQPLFQELNLGSIARGVLDEKISTPYTVTGEVGGKILEISFSPCIFDDSTTGVAIVLSTLSDTNEILETERLLSDRFDALMRESEEFIVDLDTNDRIIRVNNALARYFDTVPVALIGLLGLPSISPEDFTKIKQTAIAGRPSSDITSNPVEVRVIMPDGKVRYQKWCAYPEERNGILWSLHCIGSDITDNKIQEERIRFYESGLSTIIDERTSELRGIIKNLKTRIDDLQRIEQQQYLNESRYLRLTETISEIIWETGEDHQFTYVSPKVQDSIGEIPDNLIGKHFFDLIDDTVGQARTLDFISLLISGKPIDRMVTPIRSSDGSTQWFEISGVPNIGPDGSFHGYCGIANDITKQVLEDELKTELFSIIESAAHIVAITREDGFFSYLNKAGKKFFGLSKISDISQVCFFSFIPRADYQDYLAKRAEAAEAGYWMGDSVIISCDGTLVPVSQIIQCHRHEISKKPYFSTIIRDISDRLAFEQELATAYEYSRMLTEVNPDLIATFSVEGKILDVNAAVERVTGYPRQKLIGEEYFQFFSDPEKIKDVHVKVLLEGSVVEYATDIVHKNGRITPVIGRCVAFRDQSKHVKGVFATARIIQADFKEKTGEKPHMKQKEKPPKPPP